MKPLLRNALGIGGAVVVAAMVGRNIAEGEYGLPTLVAVGIVAAVLVRLMRISADAILLGFVLVGYIVSNRGFAQLSPVSGVPLLPAELALLAGATWALIQCAFKGELPFRKDALNLAVLAWLVLGTVRVAFDLPRYGFLAARDYAMVYYAAFFFLAQRMGREPRTAAYLRGCLIFASVILLPVYALTELFPEFFLRVLTVRGVPLIYYKDDLARSFLGVSSLLLFHWARGRNRFWAWPLSAVTFVYVVAGDNRASLLAAGAACGLLLAARRWRYPALQAATTTVVLLAVVGLAVGFGNDWAERKLAGAGDRLASFADPSGSHHYQSEDSGNKGANNRFRLVWWRNVAEETWQTNPLFGLGFGADLARGFLQEYYPDSVDEFITRSPHNLLVTVFGRLGLTGLLVWGVFCGVFLQRTWRSLRRTEDPFTWGLWCSAWVILVSACLGVVLEGPMGAVTFWTIAGIAHAAQPAAEDDDEAAEESAKGQGQRAKRGQLDGGGTISSAGLALRGGASRD